MQDSGSADLRGALGSRDLTAKRDPAPYIRESWSAIFKLLTVDLIEDPSPSGAGNADTLLMLTNAISPRVKHGSLPSLLKVCWPFERRPHVEQPAVAYRVKRAEVVHALTALIRPQEHIVVDR